VSTAARQSSPRTSTDTLADLLRVRLARTDYELREALDLRRRVFCGEQGVSPEADQDGRDGEATHVVALEGDRVVGTCRLIFRGRVARLGRLAVEPSIRRRGVGAALLHEAAEAARGAAAERIELHAQTYALELYEREGYAGHGGEFVEEGIPHLAMRKSLV
jgi:predicted GNAT family N-acyltransferase